MTYKIVIIKRSDETLSVQYLYYVFLNLIVYVKKFSDKEYGESQGVRGIIKLGHV